MWLSRNYKGCYGSKKNKEQLELFSRQINQSNDSIYTVDKNYKITSWNKGAEKLYGYTSEEAIGNVPNELLQTAITPQDLSNALDTIEEEGYWSGELKRKTKNGEDIYVRSSTSNLKDANGELTGFIGVSFNITAQKKLQAQVKHLASIVEQSTDAIRSSGLDQRIITWNKGAEKLHGYTKEEAIGKTVEALGIINRTSEQTKVFFQKVRNTGSLKTETEFFHKDGSIFYGSVTASTVKNELGEDDSLVFIIKDISDRKKLEEQLIKSNEELEQRIRERTEEIYKTEKRFRAMVENNQAIISVLDKNFVPIYISPSSDRITGWTTEERKTKPAFEMAHPDEIEAHLLMAKNLFENPGKPVHISTRSKHKDGHFIWLEGVVTNMIEDPNVGGIISNLIDITEQKKAAESKLETEILYRSLFENMLHGFAYCKPVFENQNLTDVIYIAANNQYELMTGFKNINGKKLSEIMPGLLESDPIYVERITRVLKTGEPEKFEYFIEPIGKWFLSSIYSPDKKSFVLLVDNITERKSAEDAMRKSEALYRSLFENMHHGFAYCKGVFEEDQLKDYTYLAVNERYELMTGLKNINGKKISDLMPGLLQENHGHATIINRIALSGISESFEAYVGQIGKWYATTIYSPAKEYFVMLADDITEKKHTEDTIRKSEILYRSLFENVMHGLAYCKGIFEDGKMKDFTYISVNKQYEELTGLKDVVGKNVSDLIPDLLSSDPAYADILTKAALTGISTKFETYAKPLDKWYTLTFYSPEKEYFVCLVDDVSERKHTEEAIRKSEILYRSLFENMLHGFAYCKGFFEDGRLLDFEYIAANDKYESISGLKNIIGKKISELIPGIIESDIMYSDEISKAVFTGVPTRFETYVAQVDRWFSISIYSPEADYFVSLVDNITERKQAEEKIKKLNEELEERVIKRTEQLRKTNEELEAFSYSVSHDLRAPLRGIISFTSILEDEYSSKLDDEAKRITAVIRNNTIKMGHLIDDLLSFSRTSRQDLIKTTFDTAEMVREIIREASLTGNNNRIHWTVQSLPLIYADINTLRQVWINLILNAVKYTSKKEQPRIEIGSFLQDKDHVFFIKDNGAGFDEKCRNKLFKVFQRLHSTDEFEGTGIGLAIVEKIISKHDGNVWAQGKLNKGACFYFSLPGGISINSDINNEKTTNYESKHS